MVLGAFPEGDEATIKPAWLRFAGLGDSRKSFVEFPDQTWAFVGRGPYSAFVVADLSVRPGVLIDQLEQALLTAEEGRTKRDTLKVPDAAAAPSGKPRTSLHPTQEGADAEPELLGAEGKKQAKADKRERSETTDTRGVGAEMAAAASDTGTQTDAARSEPAPGPGEPAPDASRRAPQKLMSSEGASPDEGGEIDRVLLAKEFSGLLQMEPDADEGSS
jgi:hypothetical protein